jgi:Uncharacterized conserved protein
MQEEENARAATKPDTEATGPGPAYRPDVRHTRLGEKFYDPVAAAGFPQTILRFRNDRAAREIGLESLSDKDWIRHFGRFEPLPGNLETPLALRYHGHQFRVYNPDLGDGRGFLFAQMRDGRGRLLDLATKGSGQTPWSRGGDGRLTLKGGVREVLATEMLEALGVNTSRSFSLIETGEDLMRGDEPSPTRSSVLVRLSHSHVRIGTFQRFLYLDDTDALERLVAHAIAEYWPQATDAASFFEFVVSAVAWLGAEWFAAGFVHGVLNTDNITITGESFDYGPWRFLPVLDPAFTAAYFDQNGLYAFGRQPDALYWNLARLGECLIPLSTIEALKAALDTFPALFESALAETTLARLGLETDEPERDYRLANLFYAALRESRSPFEHAFFDLAGGAAEARIAASPHAAAYRSDAWVAAIKALRERQPTKGAAEALASPAYAGTTPETMLIDEVEAIWAPIAEKDDWTLFNDKIAAVRAYGEATRKLAGR